MNMQLLKKIVNNGLIVLGLSSGLMVSATALDYSDEAEAAIDDVNVEPMSFERRKLLAEHGYAVHQYKLGNAYYNGEGVRQDYTKAVEWYKKSANQGVADAQFNLGNAYYNGEGVRQSRSTAKEYFGKACDNGLQIGCDNYRILNQR